MQGRNEKCGVRSNRGRIGGGTRGSSHRRHSSHAAEASTQRGGAGQGSAPSGAAGQRAELAGPPAASHKLWGRRRGLASLAGASSCCARAWGWSSSSAAGWGGGGGNLRSGVRADRLKPGTASWWARGWASTLPPASSQARQAVK